MYFLASIVDRKLMAINIRVQEVRAGTEFHTHRKLWQPNKAEVNHTKGAPAQKYRKVTSFVRLLDCLTNRSHPNSALWLKEVAHYT